MTYTLEQFRRDKVFMLEMLLKYDTVESAERYAQDCKRIEAGWDIDLLAVPRQRIKDAGFTPEYL